MMKMLYGAGNYEGRALKWNENQSEWLNAGVMDTSETTMHSILSFNGALYAGGSSPSAITSKGYLYKSIGNDTLIRISDQYKSVTTLDTLFKFKDNIVAIARDFPGRAGYLLKWSGYEWIELSSNPQGDSLYYAIEYNNSIYGGSTTSHSLYQYIDNRYITINGSDTTTMDIIGWNTTTY